MATNVEDDYETWMWSWERTFDAEPNIALERERLRLSPPEVVYEALSKLPLPEDLDANVDVLPKETVEELLARSEPLIDLAIARFVNYDDMYSLYKRGGALRLAALANRAVPVPFFSPERNLSQATNEFCQLLEHGTVMELIAFLTNPAHRGNWLGEPIRGVITRLTTAQGDNGNETTEDCQLNEERHMLAVELASRNPRLQLPLPDDETWDEFVANKQADEPVEELWRLLLTVPATKRWAHVLGNSFGQVRFAVPWSAVLPYPEIPTNLEAPEQKRVRDERMSRWQHDSVHAFLELLTSKWASPKEETDESKVHYSFDVHFFLRQKVIARYCKDDSPSTSVLPQLRDHHDRAIRCGYYAGAQITPEFEFDEYYEKDGDKLIDALLENDSLYLRANASIQTLVRLHDRHWHDGNIRTFHIKMMRLQEYDVKRYGPDRQERDSGTTKGELEDDEEARFVTQTEAQFAPLEKRLQVINDGLRNVAESVTRNTWIMLIWISACFAILWITRL